MTSPSAIAIAIAIAGCSGAGPSPLVTGTATPILASEHLLALGEAVTGDTRGRSDGYQPSCGDDAGGGDERWSFVPAEAGFYRFHVEADYDAVVAVRRASSDELGCNDDGASKREAEVVVELVAGQAYDVVVDGYRDATGSYRLSVEHTSGAVPEGRHGALELDHEMTESIANGSDHVTPSCGARAGSPDQVWHFVARAGGEYKFRVSGDYDSLIAVVDERGTELGCNDDFDGARGESEVTLRLEEGRAYGIVVDGYQGEVGGYRIRATRTGATTTTATATPGGGPLAIATRSTADTTNAPDTITPTCGSQQGSGDHTWVVTPTQAGTYRGTVHAQYDSVLAVYDDRNAEVVCNDDATSAQHSEVEVYLEAGRAYRFVVDGFNGARGTYEVVVELVRNTPAVTAATLQRQGTLALNRPVNALTTGATDQLTPSCGAQAGSPDHVYELTVPRRASYQIHVMSQYDSVVAIYDDALTELDCNDDLRSTNESGLTTHLERGRTYFVVVDGYNGASGAYVVRAMRERKPGRGPVIP